MKNKKTYTILPKEETKAVEEEQLIDEEQERKSYNAPCSKKEYKIYEYMSSPDLEVLQQFGEDGWAIVALDHYCVTSYMQEMHCLIFMK